MLYALCIGIYFSIATASQDHYNPINSLKKTIQNSSIQYTKCKESQELYFIPFPIHYRPHQQPCNPIILETFILHLPNGKVYSQDGVIIESDRILKDLIWHNDISQKNHLNNIDLKNLPLSTKIIGKVAVIAQNGQFCYYHWMTEVLGRLLLLESQNINYDYLFVPVSLPYMQESLHLLEINNTIIIDPSIHEYIQADELIVPSLVNQIYPIPSLASYPSPEIIKLLRHKFLPKIEALIEKYNKNNLSKKIFISRKDASIRKLTNEDELFEKLETLGFQRYCLSELSIIEQIALFHYANIIVAVHGAGLTNILFSKPQTQIIEIFQARADATYWYISQTLQFQHTCIQTCAFDQKESSIGFFDTTISQDAIDQIIDTIQSCKDLGL